jgi:hypothetical protein
MPTLTLSSNPLQTYEPEKQNISPLLREWQHCNYEFVFAPHRYCTDLQKVESDIKASSLYFPFENTENERAFAIEAKKQLKLPDDITPVLRQAHSNAFHLLNYTRSAIKALSAFGITLDQEVSLGKWYVNSRIVSRRLSSRFSFDSLLSEHFFDIKEPLVIPTMLIQPWYSLLLRQTMRPESMRIEQFLEPHPTDTNALQCTITTDNIPLLLSRGGTQTKQRETWQILQDRVHQCSVLGLPYTARIEGDFAVEMDTSRKSSFDLNECPEVIIHLTLPLITPSYSKQLLLSYQDFDTNFQEAEMVFNYFDLE